MTPKSASIRKQPRYQQSLSSEAASVLLSGAQPKPMRSLKPLALLSLFLTIGFSIGAQGQPVQTSPIDLTVPPLINAGGGDGVLGSIQAFDFALLNIETNERERKAREEQAAKVQGMVTAGIISALDLAAPTKAMLEFNRAVSALQ